MLCQLLQHDLSLAYSRRAWCAVVHAVKKIAVSTNTALLD
jgi:hypothetical protein